jgi:hypothetical protein
MAFRVNVKEVKDIIKTTLEASIINACIQSANLTVTAILGDSTDITAAQLKEIERWLSAHFLASSRQRQAQEKTIGEAKVKYSGKTGKGLESTTYGQMVMQLDTTGLIAAKLGMKKPTSIAITSFE